MVYNYCYWGNSSCTSKTKLIQRPYDFLVRGLCDSTSTKSYSSDHKWCCAFPRGHDTSKHRHHGKRCSELATAFQPTRRLAKSTRPRGRGEATRVDTDSKKQAPVTKCNRAGLGPSGNAEPLRARGPQGPAENWQEAPSIPPCEAFCQHQETAPTGHSASWRSIAVRPLGKFATHTGQGRAGKACRDRNLSQAANPAAAKSPPKSPSIREKQSAGFKSPGTHSRKTVESDLWRR